MKQEYLRRFRGYDTGASSEKISPDMSPDCRNWVNVDDTRSLHGPRQGSEPYRDYAFGEPIRHLHQWTNRANVPVIATFTDEDLYFGSQEGALFSFEQNFNTDFENAAVTLMSAGTRYYKPGSITYAGLGDGNYGVNPGATGYTSATLNDYWYYEAQAAQFSAWSDHNIVFDIGLRVKTTAYTVDISLGSFETSGAATSQLFTLNNFHNSQFGNGTAEYWFWIQPQSNLVGTTDATASYLFLTVGANDPGSLGTASQMQWKGVK